MGQTPWVIPAAAVLLVCTGWLAIARTDELTGGGFLRQQMLWSSLAFAAMLLVTLHSYRALGRWSFALFGLAILLLTAVYFFSPVNGARRWIRFGPVGFQPSEFAKLALVLAMARYLTRVRNLRRPSGLLVPLCLALVPALLVLREPDLGTALAFLPVLLVMLFVAGARVKHLAALVLAGLAAMPLAWSQMSLEQRSRVVELLEQAGPEETATGGAYHLRQAKQMAALGGVWGSLAVGQAVDDPAAYRLPAARSDFIFCVIGERLGLPGMAAVLALYGLLVWRGLAIAQAAPEPFGRLAAAGLSTLLAVEVLINTGMTVGLLPVTGLALPLVSYGGSSLVAKGILLGLLVNIGMRSSDGVISPRPVRS